MQRLEAAPPCETTLPEMLRRYREVRQFTHALCEPLPVEDYVVQSMTDCSPVKWHLAHTTWFFERFVLNGLDPHYRPLDEQYYFLFNSYYTQAGPMHARPQRGMLTRPTVEEVYDYRAQVDRLMEELLRNGTEAMLAQALPVIEIGLNHEQQHQELILTDLKHLLSLNPLHPVYRQGGPLRNGQNTPPLAWVAFPEGLYEIGHAGEGFAYDNESPRHRVFLESFQLASRLVTCGEYMEFMNDGGYEKTPLWLSEGWTVMREQGWRAPLYWQQAEDGRWRQFSLSGLRDVRPAEPVTHISLYEADAFARWAGRRLPTEPEWEVAAAGQPVAGNFADTTHFHPIPLSGRASATGLHQMFGDAWEWTSSPYSPYPGFRPPEGALGEYNGKFMCSQVILRGGSCATPPGHVRPTYRNFFYPSARWQFSGIRLAADA